jgi:hypothetical protein
MFDSVPFLVLFLGDHSHPNGELWLNGNCHSRGNRAADRDYQRYSIASSHRSGDLYIDLVQPHECGSEARK